MKRRILFLIIAQIFIILSLSAQEKEKIDPLSLTCLACHSLESPPAPEDNLKINEKIYLTSVHSRLKCTDCHLNATGISEGEIPHKKDLEDVNCTENCHRENQQEKPGQGPLFYPDSVHGRAYLQRGVQEVAKCWNCHGKHNIKKVSNPESTVNRKNIPLTCSACHENMQVVVKYNIHKEIPYHEYLQSSHGKALFEKGLLSFAAVCTDCHGVHNIKGAGEPHLMAKNPETCGGCHILIFNEYKESIHGVEALKGNIDTPLCVDCHGEHKIISPKDKNASTSAKNIPDTCSRCHARPEIMKKYGIPEDRISTFIESMHGIAIGYGDLAAANCTSCHGVHDIRPAKDPLSLVNQANLAKTCGQEKCHPGMPEKISKSKIHIDISQKKSGAPYYFQNIFLWIILVVVLITIIWFTPGFIKKIKLLKNK